MKRRGEINLFEMLKEPGKRSSGESRSATEELLYGEKRFGGARKEAPVQLDPTEELFRRFPGRKREVEGGESTETTSPTPNPDLDSSDDNVADEVGVAVEEHSIAAPAPPAAAGRWTTWGNHVVSIRRVTCVVLAAAWVTTLFVAFTAGRAGGTPMRSAIPAVTDWTDNPSWAPQARRWTKNPIRTIDDTATLNESGSGESKATPVAPSTGPLQKGLAKPGPDGEFYIQIADVGGMSRGPLLEPLMRYVDEQVEKLGAAPQDSVRSFYKEKGQRWRLGIGFFQTRAQAEAWLAEVQTWPKAHGQEFGGAKGAQIREGMISYSERPLP